MTFTSTKYGTVLKEDVVPAYPRSASQVAYRGYFSRPAKGYALLSPAKEITIPAGYYAAGYRFVNKLTGQASGFVAIAVTGLALTLKDGGAQEAPAAPARKKAA